MSEKRLGSARPSPDQFENLEQQKRQAPNMTAVIGSDETMEPGLI
jgi:hypothetical protein